MINIETTLVEIVQALEQAKVRMNALRELKADENIDGRALSIALTHLETAQLWVANARR